MQRVKPGALPLGRNCQLGMALTRFGDHESSLFRWAEIGIRPLLAFLENRSARPFAGHTEFRFVGTTFGTLSHAAMRARLPEAPEGARVNTIVFDEGCESYAHGVQLSLAEAATATYDEICAANAAKFAHLEHKWRADLAGEAPLAIRLEWAPVAETATFARLASALRRINPSVALKVVGPPGGVEGFGDGAEFVVLRSPLPPLSDVMNVAATQAAWRELFTRWGLTPRGAARAYIFDV